MITAWANTSSRLPGFGPDCDHAGQDTSARGQRDSSCTGSLAANFSSAAFAGSRGQVTAEPAVDWDELRNMEARIRSQVRPVRRGMVRRRACASSRSTSLCCDQGTGMRCGYLGEPYVLTSWEDGPAQEYARMRGRVGGNGSGSEHRGARAPQRSRQIASRDVLSGRSKVETRCAGGIGQVGNREQEHGYIQAGFAQSDDPRRVFTVALTASSVPFRTTSSRSWSLRRCQRLGRRRRGASRPCSGPDPRAWRSC